MQYFILFLMVIAFGGCQKQNPPFPIDAEKAVTKAEQEVSKAEEQLSSERGKEGALMEVHFITRVNAHEVEFHQATIKHHRQTNTAQSKKEIESAQKQIESILEDKRLKSSIARFESMTGLTYQTNVHSKTYFDISIDSLREKVKSAKKRRLSL